MNMMSILRRDIKLIGTATIDAKEFDQLQAEWIKRCPIEPHPEHAEGSSLGEVTRLLDRALSLLTDIEVAQVFDGVQMAVVPVDMKQLDRIAKLVEGVEIDLPMTGEGEGR